MRREKPDFIRVDYSLNNRGAEQRLLPAAAELGVAFLPRKAVPRSQQRERVPLGAGQAIARVGTRIRYCELGPIPPQVPACKRRSENSPVKGPAVRLRRDPL